eukprot:4859973-Prymnesium_polylepis.2
MGGNRGNTHTRQTNESATQTRAFALGVQSHVVCERHVARDSHVTRHARSHEGWCSVGGARARTLMQAAVSAVRASHHGRARAPHFWHGLMTTCRQLRRREMGCAARVRGVRITREARERGAHHA